jgi:hypothetical protein
MSETARELVEQLKAGSEWPDPALLQAIVASGPEAIAPLLEVVRRPVHTQPGEAILCYAVCLLGSLGDASVIPDLVNLFRAYDNETLEDVAESLALLGPPAVEPLLTLARDVRLDGFARADACTGAILAARNDPALMKRIVETLRALLAEQVSTANALSIPDNYLATMTAVALANLGDEDSRPLLDQAFRAGRIDEKVIRPADVEDAFRNGGEPVPEVGPTEWLGEYEEAYREELEARKTRKAAMVKHTRAPVDLSLSPIFNESNRVGRNDPCPCGSGKKYKNCHMRRTPRVR